MLSESVSCRINKKENFKYVFDLSTYFGMFIVLPPMKNSTKKIYNAFGFSKYGLNYGQIICKLLHVLTQFLVTTSEWKLHHHHQKLNVRIV